MLPTAIVDRFVERCPAVVMVRATLERLLRPMEKLSEYWPNIEALHKLCTILHSRCSEFVKSSVNTARCSSSAVSESNSYADIPWHDIVTGYQMPDLGQGFDAHEWMNTF